MYGKRGLPPPPNSWASDPDNEVGVQHITIKTNNSIIIPPATNGNKINRSFYFIEGFKLLINNQIINKSSGSTPVYITVDAGVGCELKHGSNDSKAVEVLMLQGRPIGEPVVQVSV